MSNKRERETHREERLQAESQVEGQDRRKKLLQMGAAAAFLVIIAVAVLIVVNASSGDGGDTQLEGVDTVNQELSGIPQNGMVLGDPGAPVTLIEYGDLQCPACKAYAAEILPPVIEEQIESGEAKIEFNNFTIIGPESLPAGAAALAAGAQNRGWSFVEIFYKNQGPENGGYVTDAFLTAVAESAGVTDIARWNKERKSAKVRGEVEATSEAAERLGLSSTPSFLVEGPVTDGAEQIAPQSAGDFESAIASAAG